MRQNSRQIELFDLWHRFTVHGGTANDKALRLACGAGGLDSLTERRAYNAARGLKFLVSGEHVVRAVRQRTADIVVILATEDDGMPCGNRLEALEILRKVPRQVPIAPNDIVFRNSYNCRN